MPDPSHIPFPGEAPKPQQPPDGSRGEPAEQAAAEQRLAGGGDAAAIAKEVIGILREVARSAVANGSDRAEEVGEADLRKAYRFLADLEIVEPGTLDVIEGMDAGDSPSVTRAVIHQAMLLGY
ncbi:hypothetical protein [Bradyrhizobium sp. AZCC 1708]|uniref:hypothetical protein n=1 Tax=Bradyrhizobium sp. AZCC 1708 TaxID=3117015 RepID=UPI002FF01AAD